MRAIDYQLNEPLELDPAKIESVEPRTVTEPGQVMGVVVVTMASGRQHQILVDIWVGVESVDSDEILDVWASIVADEASFCAEELASRTFRKKIIRKG